MIAARGALAWIVAACGLGAAAEAQGTTLVSADSSGTAGDSDSHDPSISADGRLVAFTSLASNLVAGDTNGWPDVFVHDRSSGVTTRVSVSSSGLQGNGWCTNGSISADGRYVAFYGLASNLTVDTFISNDVFVHDRHRATTRLVSVSSAGVQGNGDSTHPAISAEGRFVAFTSQASNLVAGDTNHVRDAFVRDMDEGSTTRVSVGSLGAQGNGPSGQVSISGDGRWVAFVSDASNLVQDDTNGVPDVFVHDRLSGSTVCVSVDSQGVLGDDRAHTAMISADGRYVAFGSSASNLVAGDTNGSPDVFVHDRQGGTTARVSVSSSGGQGNSYSFIPSISADGRFVAFQSDASNLVPDDRNSRRDIFLHDRASGRTVLMSRSSAGHQGSDDSYNSDLSADGRFVAFDGIAPDLVERDHNGDLDVFLRDRGESSQFTSLCFGDGTGAPCPCGNAGASGRGCNNSAGTGGARVIAQGDARLGADTLVLTAVGELPEALTIFFQGSELVPAVSFGDGLRCAGGRLTRLYVRFASGGTATAPGGETPVSTRSAALGDPIPLGHSRFYQTYYRDSQEPFCPAPAGSRFNASSAVAATWGP